MTSRVAGVSSMLLVAVVLLAMHGVAVARTVSIDPEARKQGMLAAPAIIFSTGLDCRLADARYMGGRTVPKTRDKKEDRIDYYEIACKAAEGFIIATHTSAATEIYTCLEAVPVKGAACQLPDDADPKEGVAPELAAAGVSCAIKDARGVGHTDDGKETVFEVACQDGAGYILHTSFPVSAGKPARVDNCLAVSLANLGQVCTLTLADAAAVDASFNALVTQTGTNCQAKNRRFVGMAQEDNSFVYEVACQDGKGYLIFQSDKGRLVKTTNCATVVTCTLSDPREPEIEKAQLYSKRAQTTGFACDVLKFVRYQANTPGEVVELQCSNREDGAIAIFPAGETDPARIYDCAHSELIGFRCQYTQAAAAYPNLTNDLRKLGKAGCVVSNSRVAGKAREDLGYIEVACADGRRGFMIGYALPAMTPTEALACELAKYLGGGCTLPGNTKHG
jgi:hypothetical protein